MPPALSDSVSYYANIALLVALALGVVATGLIFWTSLIKDRAFVEYRLATEAKVAEANARGVEAGASAGRANLAAAQAQERAALANERAAAANERAEELQKTNLALEVRMQDVRRKIRGREISDEQVRLVSERLRGKSLPKVVVYVAHDVEAQMYAQSIVSLLEELGLKGEMAFLNDVPTQPGVMFCGTGSGDEIPFMDALMDAKIITVGSVSSQYATSYCPPGSIFVGVKQPESIIRSPNKVR